MLFQSTADKKKEGVCYGFIAGLDIQILYAGVGSFQNPQACVVGARYNFVYADQVAFQVRCTLRSRPSSGVVVVLLTVGC